MAESSSFTPIVVYHSETAGALPAAVNLNVGELALNIADRKLYTKDSNGNIVEIVSGAGGTGGEANTSSNAGAGEGLALPKSGVDLPFKSLVAGSNVTLTSNADTVTIAATGGGSSSTVGQHRYWRVTLGGLVFASGGGAGSVSVGEIILYTGGEGFKNGYRWSKGDPVDYTGASISSSGHTASWSSILQGGGASTVIPVTSDTDRKGFEIDFGAGNETHISGLDFVSSTVDASGRLNAVKFEYSDDGVTFTEASEVTGILQRIGSADGPGDGSNIIDLDIPIPHVGNIGGDGTPGINAIFDQTVSTIPDSNDTQLWTWNTTRQSVAFGAAPNTYYTYIDNAVTVTLPDTPPAGTVVGLATNNAITVVAGFFGSNLINGSTPTVSWGVGNASDESQSQHVLLCYVDATYGWAVVGGEIRNLSS